MQVRKVVRILAERFLYSILVQRLGCCNPARLATEGDHSQVGKMEPTADFQGDETMLVLLASHQLKRGSGDDP